MKRIPGYELVCVLGCWLVLPAISGCQQGSSSKPSASATASPSPEDSFELIYEIFRRGMENGAQGVQAGGVSRGEGGTTIASINNEVRRQMYPPAKVGDPYRATITVVSQTRYSILRSGGTPEEEARANDGKKRGAETETGADEGIEILDNTLIIPPGGRRTGAGPSGEDPLRRSDEDLRNYELEYVNGRWELITPLDPNRERAAANAFRRALESQE